MEVRWRFGGAVVKVGALEGGDVQVVAVRFGLDFSVLPIQVSGDPAAPAMAIGWRAADLIRNCLTTLEATSWRRHPWCRRQSVFRCNAVIGSARERAR